MNLHVKFTADAPGICIYICTYGNLAIFTAMASYEYVVLPLDGFPYKIRMQAGESELAFLQNAVGGYIEEIRTEMAVNPMFRDEGWVWARDLLHTEKVDIEGIYVNDNGLFAGRPNPALVMRGWTGAMPVMGEVVIKMTTEEFEKSLYSESVFESADDMWEKYNSL